MIFPALGSSFLHINSPKILAAERISTFSGKVLFHTDIYRILLRARHNVRENYVPKKLWLLFSLLFLFRFCYWWLIAKSKKYLDQLSSTDVSASLLMFGETPKMWNSIRSIYNAWFNSTCYHHPGLTPGDLQFSLYFVVYSPPPGTRKETIPHHRDTSATTNM